MMFLSILILLFSAFSSNAATKESFFPLETHLVHEFPLGTYIHSLAVRQHTGDVLVTIATAPEVILISTNDDFQPVKVATIPGVGAAISILETSIDEFYITAGNLSVTAKTSATGSYSVWKLDMRKGSNSSQLVKVTDIKEAALLDRLTSLDSETLLIADSILGIVWSLNTTSGDYHAVINDPASMSPVTPSGVGINDVGIYGEYLYYDNSEKGQFSRIPIDAQTGTAIGPAQILLQNNNTLYPQGFTIRGDDLWLANGLSNEVFLLPRVTSQPFSQQSLKVVAGSLNSTAFAGPTDCKFGTSPHDLARGSLYISTCGISNHKFISGGSLFRLDVGCQKVPTKFHG